MDQQSVPLPPAGSRGRFVAPGLPRPSMISFSTSEVPPDERFDHWREVRGKQLFGVTIELERERRADFA
ncbi:hypothetical protein ABTF55_21760, partial [Acinetobacter baumannii]